MNRLRWTPSHRRFGAVLIVLTGDTVAGGRVGVRLIRRCHLGSVLIRTARCHRRGDRQRRRRSVGKGPDIPYTAYRIVGADISATADVRVAGG